MNQSITTPDSITAMLAHGAALAISISGGKDSQALLNTVSAWHQSQGFAGELFAIHSDLGRTEWSETPGHVARICQEAEVKLVIVRREQGDLLARWQERMAALAGTGKPFWSSATNRYCTSDLKRGPINSYLRRFKLIVSAEGIRAEESPARARKPVAALREEITATALQRLSVLEGLQLRNSEQRLAVTWNPLLHWSKTDVWTACGTSEGDLERRQRLYQAGHEAAALAGWVGHPAYVYGNERLSCAICVLASKRDIQNGARHHPELYRELVRMEQASGCTFRHKQSLEAIVEGDGR